MQRLQNPLVAATLLSCAVAAQAQPRPAVIELFTSEGCSSCPPAEAYLGELAQRPDVLALAFHVDYWDDLGWRDRFELTEATPRQRLYAKALRLPSIYTPQLMVDGRVDFVGNDRAAISKALAEPRQGVAVVFAVRDGDIQIDVGAQDGGRPCDVLLVTYLRSATSAIGRGENAGRTLTEFNIVRSLQNLGHWTGQAQQYHATVKLLPSDATDVAVLVQPAGQGPVVGAATHALR
ncbi:MAG: DUF1223 domain-containing protein [Gammaproteobacteria bacterium]